MSRILLALCAAVLTAPCMACNTFYIDPPTAVTQTDGSSYATYYTAENVDLGLGGPEQDQFGFELYNFTHPFMSGTFDLGSGDNTNYSTCNECVLMVTDGGSPSDKLFFQSAGSLTVDASTPPLSDPIKVRYTGLRLIEVTVDPSTFVSTPVPGGVCYDVLMDTILRDSFEGS